MPDSGPEPQILDAARRAVECHGYSGLSLERIAEEAEVSRVTLHRRGFSYEEIFRALVLRTREEHRDAIWPALLADGDGATRLRLAVGKRCDLCERDLDLMLAISAYLDATVHSADKTEDPSYRLVLEPFQVLAREGIADGSLRPGDPEVFAALAASSAGSTYVHLRVALGWGRKRSRATIVEETMAAFAVR